MQRVMHWVLSLLFILGTGSALPLSMAQSDQSTYSGGYYPISISRDRFIDQFKSQSARDNLQDLNELSRRSQYEFNRNLEWLRAYARSAIWDQPFRDSLDAFLLHLGDEMRFFPEDLMLLVRIVEGLGEIATPIADDITTLMNLNWYQRRLMSIQEAILVESTLILLSWHQDVELYYSSDWRSLANSLMASDICIEAPSCVERVRNILARE